MSRYIQASVSDEDHSMFSKFAFLNDMTLGQFLEKAAKKYIEEAGREEKTLKELGLSE